MKTLLAFLAGATIGLAAAWAIRAGQREFANLLDSIGVMPDEEDM